MKKSELFYQVRCLVGVSYPASSPYDERIYICGGLRWWPTPWSSFGSSEGSWMQPHEPLISSLVQGDGVDLQKEMEEIRINKKIKQVKKKKKDSLLLTGNLEFSKAIKRIEKVSIIVVAHIITDTPNTFYIRTPLTGVPKPFVSDRVLHCLSEPFKSIFCTKSNKQDVTLSQSHLPKIRYIQNVSLKLTIRFKWLFITKKDLSSSQKYLHTFKIF